MNKEELFKKYCIVEKHNKWDDPVDNWTSVELYKLMHDEDLPSENNDDLKWVIEFLNKLEEDKLFCSKMFRRKDFGNLYLTAKRIIYRFANEILTELK